MRIEKPSETAKAAFKPETFKTEDARKAAIAERRQALRAAEEAAARDDSGTMQSALDSAHIMYMRAVAGTIEGRLAQEDYEEKWEHLTYVSREGKEQGIARARKRFNAAIDAMIGLTDEDEIKAMHRVIEAARRNLEQCEDADVEGEDLSFRTQEEKDEELQRAREHVRKVEDAKIRP